MTIINKPLSSLYFAMFLVALFEYNNYYWLKYIVDLAQIALIIT